MYQCFLAQQSHIPFYPVHWKSALHGFEALGNQNLMY